MPATKEKPLDLPTWIARQQSGRAVQSASDETRVSQTVAAPCAAIIITSATIEDRNVVCSRFV
jgi:Rad3-related DNA helicase